MKRMRYIMRLAWHFKGSDGDMLFAEACAELFGNKKWSRIKKLYYNQNLMDCPLNKEAVTVELNDAKGSE